MTALEPDTGATRREPGGPAAGRPVAGGRPSGGVKPAAENRPTVDLTRAEGFVTVTRTTSPGHDGDDTDAHLLRLCLDLQLDSMLLTLGAAAAQRVRDDEAWVPGAAPPWRRWVDEDVELAASLAADALGGGATLPSTLGTETDHRAPETVLDNLVARYEWMSELLSDLLVRDVPGAEGWRPRVRDALFRCRTRLADLRAYRAPSSPPMGLSLDAATSATSATSGSGRSGRDHEYLPGELLG